MTPATVITEVRRLVQDTRVPFRYSDADLLSYVNQTLKRMVILRPDLFARVEDIAVTANTVVQNMPAQSLRLIEIYSVTGRNAVTEVNRESLDQTYPGWVSDPAGIPYNYMRHVRNPNKYFLYPRPQAGVTLVAEYARVPDTYTLDTEIAELTEAYLPVLVDGAVYLASAIDNEHVSSGRAKLFLDSFTSMLSAGLSSRIVTDTEDAGLDKKQVV